MSWARIDDTFFMHRKVVEAGNEAVGAWVRLLSYAYAYKTGGDISAVIAVNLLGEKRAKDILARLVEVRLLDVTDDGAYRIHDFGDYSAGGKGGTPSKRSEAAKKAAAARWSKGDGADAAPKKSAQNAETDADAMRSACGADALAHAEPMRSACVDDAQDDASSDAKKCPRSRSRSRSRSDAYASDATHDADASDADEPEPRKPTTDELYREAYVAGIRRCTGAWSWPGDGGQRDPNQADLNTTARDFGLGPNGKPLRGPALLAWISREAEAFARAKGGPDEVAYFSMLAPKGWKRWLNGGRLGAPPIELRTADPEPDGTGTPLDDLFATHTGTEHAAE